MAVTMVIGNRPEIAKSLLAPGYTLASVIANEFSEATDNLYLSALFEIGLALFLVTIIVNALAHLLVWSVTRGTPARAHAQ
jgi:phosphate transport system permease protein